MFRSRRTAALLGLTSLFLSCGTEPEQAPASDRPPLPELEYEGEHVRVGTDAQLRVCAGNLADFDRAIEAFEAEVEIDPEGKSALYILEDEALYEAWCPDDSGGCANAFGGEHRAFTRRHSTSAIWHELAHDRVGRAGLGGSASLLSEGIAELQSRAFCAPDPGIELPALDELLEDSWRIKLYWYVVAGHLVHGLVRTHGIAALKSLMLALERDDDAETVRAVYSEELGVNIDDDYTAFQWGAEGRHRYALECRGEPPPTEGRRSRLQASLDCTDPQVRAQLHPRPGDAADEGYVEWVLEVEADAVPNFDWSEDVRYELVGEIPEDTRLLINRCGCKDIPSGEWDPWEPGDPIEGPDPRAPRSFSAYGEFLAPGLYRLRWEGPLDAGQELDVEIVRACNVAAQDCPGDQQCRVGDCEPGVPDPAAVGEPCTQIDGGPHVCVPGSYCLGEFGDGQVEGWCTQQCGEDEDCPAGEGCGVYGLCGPPCDWLAADCAPGYSCVPPQSELPSTCLPNGGLGQLEPCLFQSDCMAGLACASVEGCNVGVFGGCCVPTCELAQPDCPAELPSCSASELYEGFGFGVCLE